MTDTERSSVIELMDLTKAFKDFWGRPKVKAVNNLNLEIRKGEVFSIIGPNGAGKTCLLNCINRFYHPEKGSVILEGQDISHLKPHAIAGLGIARTFQNVELFGHMSVLDNIKLGAHVHLKSGFLSGGIYFGKSRKEEIELRKHIEEKIIDLLEIEQIRKSIVHSLPYGLQKRVELARALAMKPKILLLDEPAAFFDNRQTDRRHQRKTAYPFHHRQNGRIHRTIRLIYFQNRNL